MPDQIHDHLIGKDTFRMHDQEGKDIKFLPAFHSLFFFGIWVSFRFSSLTIS